MPEHPHTPTSQSRAEKLQAIAAIFGEDVAGLLIRSGGEDRSAGTSTAPVDPDRLAWQQNRLIQHLRVKAGPTKSPPPERPAQRPDQVAATPKTVSTKPAGCVLDRMRQAAKTEQLPKEHPAVIAQLLKSEPHAVQVTILRQLPGRMARGIIQRLRALQ